jgi:hypothetical protein
MMDLAVLSPLPPMKLSNIRERRVMRSTINLSSSLRKFLVKVTELCDELQAGCRSQLTIQPSLFGMKVKFTLYFESIVTELMFYKV